MKTMKKLVASAVVASMMFSFAGCDKAGKQVEEAAATVSEAIVDMDIAELAELADIDDDELIDMGSSAYELGRGETADAIEAVFDTMTYEVDNSSFSGSTKDKKASIDVTFTVVDFESIIDEEPDDADEFIDMIADTEDTIELTTTLKFKLHGESWDLDSIEDIFEDVFEPIFRADYPFESPLAEKVGSLKWWNASDNIDGVGYYYGTPSCLELDIIPAEGYNNSNFTWEFYFELYNQGGSNLIYTSGNLSDAGYYIEAYGYASNTQFANSGFPSDTYRIVFYDLNGAVIAESTAIVE